MTTFMFIIASFCLVLKKRWIVTTLLTKYTPEMHYNTPVKMAAVSSAIKRPVLGASLLIKA
jgi:hypothetical protein